MLRVSWARSLGLIRVEAVLRNPHYEERQINLRQSQLNAVNAPNQRTVEMALGGDGTSGSKASSGKMACKSEWPLPSIMGEETRLRLGLMNSKPKPGIPLCDDLGPVTSLELSAFTWEVGMRVRQGILQSNTCLMVEQGQVQLKAPPSSLQLSPRFLAHEEQITPGTSRGCG